MSKISRPPPKFPPIITDGVAAAIRIADESGVLSARDSVAVLAPPLAYRLPIPSRNIPGSGP
jgi:hypothetical protein